MRALNRDHTVDAILISGRDPLLMTAGIRAARAVGAAALHEVTELPDVVRAPGLFGKVAHVYFLLRQLPALDGLLAISRPIQHYIARWTAAPVLLLGLIVDLDAHAVLPRLNFDRNLVIGYAGSLLERKDGVLTLIRATALAADQLAPDREVHLRVLGDADSAAGQMARSEAALLGIASRVEFCGQVPHSEVAALLAACHVLVLPRPVSRQATGGLPTKLGEYLATGRPVLTTAVGEIPRYLRGGDTCLMVPPNDVGALAAALASLAQNYDEAQRIGARGRQVAERFFAAPKQAATVAEFVAALEKDGSDD